MKHKLINFWRKKIYFMQKDGIEVFYMKNAYFTNSIGTVI